MVLVLDINNLIRRPLFSFIEFLISKNSLVQSMLKIIKLLYRITKLGYKNDFTARERKDNRNEKSPRYCDIGKSHSKQGYVEIINTRVVELGIENDRRLQKTKNSKAYFHEVFLRFLPNKTNIFNSHAASLKGSLIGLVRGWCLGRAISNPVSVRNIVCKSLTLRSRGGLNVRLSR